MDLLKQANLDINSQEFQDRRLVESVVSQADQLYISLLESKQITNESLHGTLDRIQYLVNSKRHALKMNDKDRIARTIAALVAIARNSQDRKYGERLQDILDDSMAYDIAKEAEKVKPGILQNVKNVYLSIMQDLDQSAEQTNDMIDKLRSLRTVDFDQALRGSGETIR